MGRHLYTPLSERAHKGGKVTSTGSQSDQYWSPRQPVLVTMGEQYCSDQRPVLVVIAPSEAVSYSPHCKHDAEGSKNTEIAGIASYTSGEAKPRDRARGKALSIAVHRRSIIRSCGDNYWSASGQLLVSESNHYSFRVQTTIHSHTDQ